MQSCFIPRAKDQVSGPGWEENLALIETIVGENSRAISILTELLHTPYKGFVYAVTPITPALLRLDPIWDPLRSDPAFQKLCVVDCVADSIWLAVPQSTGWQRIGIKVYTTMLGYRVYPNEQRR